MNDSLHLIQCGPDSLVTPLRQRIFRATNLIRAGSDNSWEAYPLCMDDAQAGPLQVTCSTRHMEPLLSSTGS